MDKLTINSYAKLNLYLRVINKRKDGYHNLETLFERINLSDKIILERRSDGKIKILSGSPDIPKDETNLAYRSAALLQKKLKLSEGVNITIKKNIPVASGMGGGSSNAASVLIGLNRLWRLKLSRLQLARIGGQIGSDVPFFIYDCPFALAGGRGDKIKPLNYLRAIRLWHILVVPKIRVSTPLIYKKWDEFTKNNQKSSLTSRKSNVNILLLALKRRDLASISAGLYNSLAPVTTRLYPEITVVIRHLTDLGLKGNLMSGSGPAVFGICSSRKEAQAVSKAMCKRNYRVFWGQTF